MMELKEEQIISSSEGVERITPRNEFKGNDGFMWYLIPRETMAWPNGNPYKILYETIWGNKLIVWLNEVGGLIFARYA